MLAAAITVKPTQPYKTLNMLWTGCLTARDHEPENNHVTHAAGQANKNSYAYVGCLGAKGHELENNHVMQQVKLIKIHKLMLGA